MEAKLCSIIYKFWHKWSVFSYAG